MGNQAIGIRY